MLTMSQINCIRDLSKQGYDISKIHTCTGVDRKTIRKYLEQDDFSPKPPVVKRRTSIVAPYIDVITEWLEEDQKHWSKQRHTAKRIHERLVEEYGFTGSYDSVQKFVQRVVYSGHQPEDPCGAEGQSGTGRTAGDQSALWLPKKLRDKKAGSG